MVDSNTLKLVEPSRQAGETWGTFIFYPNPEHDSESGLWLVVLFNRTKNWFWNIRIMNRLLFELNHRIKRWRRWQHDAVGDILKITISKHSVFKEVKTWFVFYVSWFRIMFQIQLKKNAPLVAPYRLRLAEPFMAGVRRVWRYQKDNQNM